jgi:uncharacterized membrane protein
MNATSTKLIKAFRVNILVGLLLLAPLVGTLLILNFVITFVSNHVLPGEWLKSNFAILYRIAALAIVIAAIYFVGLLTRNYFGRKIYRLADNILTRIPVINSVYTSIRQISEAVVNSQSTLFKDVVAVQFPRAGMYSLGFITARAPDVIARKIFAEDHDMVSVFVPTTPNPTTGFYLLLPRADIIYLNISVTAAMKLVISGGAANPWRNEAESKLTLLDYIEAWLKRGEAPSGEQRGAFAQPADMSGAALAKGEAASEARAKEGETPVPPAI